MNIKLNWLVLPLLFVCPTNYPVLQSLSDICLKLVELLVFDATLYKQLQKHNRAVNFHVNYSNIPLI